MATNRQLAPPPRHISAPSQDTNASGTADSTISNGGESMVLSQFPTPPVSISSGPPIRTTPASPLRIVRRKPLPIPGPLQKAQSSQPSTPASPAQSSTSQINPISPYDWHDGASSIGMDATEDRLLSTSFITNLLQESANRRVSNGSSVISGFSEMTYPPLASTMANHGMMPVARHAPSRPQGGRLPPSSFVPIPESLDPLLMSDDGDSETLYSQRDQSSIARMDPSPHPVGIAPAVLGNISPMPGSSHQHIPSSELLVPQCLTIPRNRDVASSNYQSRESVHSTKSAVSSFVSKISSYPPVQRLVGWRRAKPLPPVPLIPHIPITEEMQHRREDENKPLPELVNRADALQGLLEKGYHPHHSLHSYYVAIKDTWRFDGHTIFQEATNGASQSGSDPRSMQPSGFAFSRSQELAPQGSGVHKRRKMVLLGIGTAIVLAIIAIAVGVVVGRKKGKHSCPGEFAGASCNLNATCVCTSLSSGQCDPLAQNIVELIPSLNSFFSLNLTSNQVYNQIWLVQGSTPDSCKEQSVLVDVGPNLQSETQPKVTLWAQTALLWTVVLSQNLPEVAKLQAFVQKARWSSLQSSIDALGFTTNVLGHTYNFVAQTILPIPTSFIDLGQPSDDQLSRVNTGTISVLDRMYSFAQAESTLRGNALRVYWTNVLKQDIQDLETFISALRASPILLPFDATLPSVSKLLNSTPVSFPPPISCYPNLSASQLQQVSVVETQSFNLSNPTSPSQFDPTCFPDRPVYGILDVLHQRLAFSDPRTGVPRQATVLKGAVSSRVLLRSGAVLSPLPGPSNLTNITSNASDARNYGTLGLSSHIILNYLLSIPDLGVAHALVKYILSSASVQIPPPDNSSILFTSLLKVPTLEIAVFGSISAADIDHAQTAFTLPSGSFFFGTDQGTALRNWVISGCNSAIAWAESIFSQKIVRDSTFSDPIFNQTWNAVYTAVRNNIQNVGLVNVTNSFEVNGRFTVY